MRTKTKSKPPTMTPYAFCVCGWYGTPQGGRAHIKAQQYPQMHWVTNTVANLVQAGSISQKSANYIEAIKRRRKKMSASARMYKP